MDLDLPVDLDDLRSEVPLSADCSSASSSDASSISSASGMIALRVTSVSRSSWVFSSASIYLKTRDLIFLQCLREFHHRAIGRNLVMLNALASLEVRSRQPLWGKWNRTALLDEATPTTGGVLMRLWGR